jgi:hypothetical protein
MRSRTAYVALWVAAGLRAYAAQLSQAAMAQGGEHRRGTRPADEVEHQAGLAAVEPGGQGGVFVPVAAQRAAMAPAATARSRPAWRAADVSPPRIIRKSHGSLPTAGGCLGIGSFAGGRGSLVVAKSVVVSAHRST